MSRLERIEKLCAPAIGLFVLLWILTAFGVPILPPLPAAGIVLLAAALAALSFAGGRAAVLRSLEINEKRWEIVSEPLLTGAEREWAHKEAERQMRWASTMFFSAPLALGVCLGEHLRSVSTDPLASGPASVGPLALLLAGAPLLGFFAGYLYARSRHKELPPPH